MEDIVIPGPREVRTYSIADMPAWGARSEEMAERSRQDRKRLRKKLEPWFEKQCSASRRAGNRGSRRMSFGGARMLIPSDVTSVQGLTWVRADLGYTIATGVSSWEDLLPAGTGDFTQGTAGFQPAHTGSGGANDFPFITGDGSDDRLGAAIDRPPPGTTPTYYALVVRQNSWTLNDDWCGSSTTQLRIGQRVGDPQVNMNNGSGVNTISPTLATWFVVQALFANSSSDFLKLGSEPRVQASAGNANPGATFTIFNATGGTGQSAISLSEFVMWAGVPSELPDISAYWQRTFGLSS